MSKILILGLDGLDYYLSKRWNVKHILQRFNGTFDVSDISILYTPLIWSSILCGYNVEKRGYNYNTAVKKSLGILGVFYNVKRKIIKKRTPFLRTMLIKLGLLKANFIMPKDLRKDSFLEILKNKGFKVYALEVPGYNEELNGKYRLKMHDIVTAKISIKKKFIECVKEDSLRRLREISFALEGYDVVMGYLPLPDLAHHLFYHSIKSKIFMYGLYRWLDSVVYTTLLKKAYELGFTVIILSDHGFLMERNTHSPYAFWSSNISLVIKTYKDIKNQILKIIRK